MKYDLKPNDPRPVDKVVVGASNDARWREVADDVERIDRLDQHSQMQDARPRSKPSEKAL